MKEFKTFLQQKGLSVSTQNFYCYQAERFLKWYSDSYRNDVINAQTKDVLKYLDYLQNKRSVQNSTRQNHLTSIDHYFQFIGLPTVTAFIELKGTKKHKLQYIFSTEELAQLYDNYHAVYIQNFNPNDWKTSIESRWRNYIMLGLLVFQGVQTGELDTLTVNDVDFTKARIHITPKHSRGNARTLALEATQIGGMMYYLHTIRPQLLTSDTDKLFLPVSRYMRPEDRHKQSMMNTLRNLNKDLKKLHKDYHKMTQLRTSVITHWIKTQGLRKAQVLAGHKSIVSTEEYIHNDLESLVDDISKFNPFSL